MQFKCPPSRNHCIVPQFNIQQSIHTLKTITTVGKIPVTSFNQPNMASVI